MLLKKLLMLNLLILLSVGVFAEPFEFDPPAFQQGDEDKVLVSIGNMRQAIYYKETAELLKDKYNTSQDLLEEAAKDLAYTEAQVIKEKDKKVFYRNTTIAFVIVDTIAVLLLTRK